ncbi:MAG TPA: M15 family metallopeptidase [Acidimicrobiales bacterium]|nr:M15 family metallopeptidase [Acidimicrobiales bacterium]
MGAGTRSGERGSVVPLVALVVLLVGGLCAGVARSGVDAVTAARVRTAADAAALAGAAAGERAAVEAARANGAEVVAHRREGREVEVTVRLAGFEATARATRTGPSPADASVAGLVPEMLAALAAAEVILGQPVPVTSGWRSPARQQALWDARHTNRYPVAPPGTSAHERGRAVDVPIAFVPRLVAVAPRVGLCQPLPRTDPVHFELCPSGRDRS